MTPTLFTVAGTRQGILPVQPVFFARYSEPSAKLRFLFCPAKRGLYPPNFPQTVQYKGVTSIIYKTKDLRDPFASLRISAAGSRFAHAR